jgi:hypothetical protein
MPNEQFSSFIIVGQVIPTVDVLLGVISL